MNKLYHLQCKSNSYWIIAKSARQALNLAKQSGLSGELTFFGTTIEDLGISIAV